MKPLIFIDGEAGTTGLQINARLTGRSDIELLQLPHADRKSPSRRSEALNSCDIAILCLPDDAAREAVAFIENPKVRVLDPSSAQRTAPGWEYGLPELTAGQAERIATATRVSNPGCYPTGAICLLRPLTEAGVLPRDYPVNVHAISGYSGSGRSLIDAYEVPDHPQHTTAPYRGYGLDLKHKHIAEMTSQAQLAHRPIFTPGYARYRQGIVLYVPLHLRLLPAGTSAAHIHACLSKHYQACEFINVVPLEQSATVAQLDPEYLNDTNELDIHVFANEQDDQVILVAIYDNLGKGASGAAVQNLDLMLNGQA